MQHLLIAATAELATLCGHCINVIMCDCCLLNRMSLKGWTQDTGTATARNEEHPRSGLEVDFQHPAWQTDLKLWFAPPLSL